MKNIIKRAVITEKATQQSEKQNRFSFVVDRNANKIEIKNAVEKLYGVQILDVRTMNYGGGKSATKFTNKGVIEQRSKQWKKAIVTVAPGETIDLYGNF